MGLVLPFPGQPLVCVAVRPDVFAIMLVIPGAKNSSWQTSYDTLEDAVREAREEAALCGWRCIGVFDRDRTAHIQNWSGGGNRRQPHTSAGPAAARVLPPTSRHPRAQASRACPQRLPVPTPCRTAVIGGPAPGVLCPW